MGWFDKSPESKAEECPECADALAASKRGEGPVKACERCGHLYLATCNCDLAFPPADID